MGTEVQMTKKHLKSKLEDLEKQRMQVELQYQQILGAIAVTTKYIEDFDADPVFDSKKKDK